MDKKFEEIEKIEQIRTKITELTELISNEKPLMTLIKENPAAATLIIIGLGILTAIISRKVIKLIFALISFGLKIATYVYFIRYGISLLPKFKRIVK
ncbi:MAG TPA: hypothetical protein P5556_00510 [Candidatus Gastranaerophilales bacterium]|nr:hypothetical protein [Candidatus Gastranaerophilales bacterium]